VRKLLAACPPDDQLILQVWLEARIDPLTTIQTTWSTADLLLARDALDIAHLVKQAASAKGLRK
jgi:hypothetical protein